MRTHSQKIVKNNKSIFADERKIEILIKLKQCFTVNIC